MHTKVNSDGLYCLKTPTGYLAVCFSWDEEDSFNKLAKDSELINIHASENQDTYTLCFANGEKMEWEYIMWAFADTSENAKQAYLEFIDTPSELELFKTLIEIGLITGVDLEVFTTVSNTMAKYREEQQKLSAECRKRQKELREQYKTFMGLSVPGCWVYF